MVDAWGGNQGVGKRGSDVAYLLVEEVCKIIREKGGGGGGGWRSEEKVSNSFLGLEAEDTILVWKKAALAAVREEEKVERREWKLRRSSGSLPFLHLRSAALSLRLSARTESDSQGAGGVGRAGLEVRGHRLSREEERVERRRSVAVLGGRREKDSWVGRAVITEEARSDGESERRCLRTETM